MGEFAGSHVCVSSSLSLGRVGTGPARIAPLYRRPRSETVHDEQTPGEFGMLCERCGSPDVTCTRTEALESTYLCRKCEHCFKAKTLFAQGSDVAMRVAKFATVPVLAAVAWWLGDGDNA
jgi:hypothetical protein